MTRECTVCRNLRSGLNFGFHVILVVLNTDSDKTLLSTQPTTLSTTLLGAPLEHGSPSLSFKTQPRHHFNSKDHTWPSTPGLTLTPEGMLSPPTAYYPILCVTLLLWAYATFPVYKSVSPGGREFLEDRGYKSMSS